MTRAFSTPTRYRTRLSNGSHETVSDVAADKGGGGSGFRPHDLLESALASCVSITVRMYADSHDIPLRDVTTTVSLDRRDDETVFHYELAFDGELSEQQKERLTRAAAACPVRRTLSKPIRFEFEPASTSAPAG